MSTSAEKRQNIEKPSLSEFLQQLDKVLVSNTAELGRYRSQPLQNIPHT